MLQGLVMGISRTEINLRRLLAAAPQQQNQAKLIHVCFFAFFKSNINFLMSYARRVGSEYFSCFIFFRSRLNCVLHTVV